MVPLSNKKIVQFVAEILGKITTFVCTILIFFSTIFLVLYGTNRSDLIGCYSNRALQGVIVKGP